MKKCLIQSVPRFGEFASEQDTLPHIRMDTGWDRDKRNGLSWTAKYKYAFAFQNKRFMGVKEEGGRWCAVEGSNL